MTIAAVKQRLRTQHRQQRRALSEQDRTLQQSLLDAQCAQILKKWQAPIAAYMALPEECSCQWLIDACLAKQQPLYLPKVAAAHQLTWHQIRSLHDLERGAYGILEPKTQVQELPTEILILVPGLAFNAAGQRLGMGGGFYDGVLTALTKSACSIGLAWDCQIEEVLPVEQHDATVDAVLAGGAWLSTAPAWLLS